MENTYTPLKQYLPQGQDFSMSNLSNLAASKGMSGYKGTDEQNKQLYSSLSQPSSSPAVVSNYGMNSKVNDITNKSIQLGVVTPNQVAQNQQINNPQPQPQQIDYSTAPYQTDANGTKLYYNPSSGQYDQYETKGGVVNYGGMSVPSETLSDPYLKSIIDNQITAQKQNKTALDSQLEAIKNRFIQYRDTQNQLNQSGQAGVQNALLQSGAGNRGSVAQYAAATADARVNVMVQDGIKKLQELDNQEQELVSAARQAYESNNYKILSSINQAIEQKRQEQVAASAELNKRLAAEKANADAAKKQAVIDNDIAGLYTQGITDPVQIMSQLKASGKTYSLAQINDTIKNLVPSGLDDLVKTMRQNGAPVDVIKKAMSAKDINSAYEAAGVYSAGGTGQVAEYNFYRAQMVSNGLPYLTYNEWLTEDANRKARIDKNQTVDPVTGQILKVVTNKEITDLNDAQIARTSLNNIADNLIANIKTYGTQALFGTAAGDKTSFKSNLLLAMKNLEKTGALDQGTIDVLAGTIPSNEFFATENAQIAALNRLKEVVNGKVDEYISSYTETTASTDPRTRRMFENQKVINQNMDDTKLFESLKNNPVEVQQEVGRRYQDLQEVLGRPPTATEYFETYPYDRPKTNTQSNVTDVSKKIVGGIDFKTYATDPNHVKAVATLYNKVPSDKQNLQTYIQQVSPNSPISAEEIINISNSYNIDPKIMTALLQHESKIGTSTVAMANNNFGGITWTPTYAKNNPGVQKGSPRPSSEGGYYAKFPSVEAGLAAQAELLSKRKIV